MTFAFVFPGQGSQSVGMLNAFADHAAVKETLAEASDALGQDIGKLIAEVAAETPSEPELARRELAGAVRRTTMKILRAEQDRLVAAGLPDEASRNRYREIAATLEHLRAEGERDLLT
jgi:malonyl CoA-acyl carrier protein transacylase